MGTTFKRVCIKDYTIRDGATEFTIKRGEEYITSPEQPDGSVTVYSRYWCEAPVGIFAGAEQFTGRRG